MLRFVYFSKKYRSEVFSILLKGILAEMKASQRSCTNGSFSSKFSLVDASKNVCFPLFCTSQDFLGVFACCCVVSIEIVLNIGS